MYCSIDFTMNKQFFGACLKSVKCIATVACSDARRPRTLGDDGADSRLAAVSNDQKIKVGLVFFHCYLH